MIQHLGTDTTAPGATTSYHYDLLGQLTAMTDDKANTWTYGYDLAGNKIFSHDPDKGTTTSTYDAAGQLTSTTDARNVTLKYFYDNLGRPTTTTKADGTTTLISTSYDTVQKGQVTASSRHLAGGTLTSRVNSYDIAGRATSTSMIVPEIAGLIGAQLAGTYTSTTSFNADGSIQNQTLPAAGPIPTETLTTGYTPLTGQPDTLTGTLGSTTATYVQDTQYLAWGTPVAMLFGTHSGRLSQVTFQRDDTTQRLTGTDLYRSGQGGVSDESDTLSYDPAGNITQVKAALADGSVDNQCFSYDYQQQLTEAWTPTGTSCDPNGRSQANLAGPAPYWTSWTTDSIGKTSQRIDRTVTKSSTTSYSYTANGENASRPHFVTGTATTGSSPGTASYTADAAGNTATRPNPGGGTQTLMWDDLNQLTDVTKDGATIARMVYDTSGTRVLRKQGDTTTLYVGGDEITLNTATSAVTANRYYTHGGQTVAVRAGASNDTVTTLISDWQGTTHHQIGNATGALATSWQDPYGNPRGTPPTTWTGERGYVGGTKDATGLTRIGARDYDTALQRFITVDPLQDLADPLQWNPYIYSNNSPITKADPTGLVPAGPSLIDGIYRVVATKDKKGRIHRKVVPTAGELQRRAWLRRVKAASIAAARKRAEALKLWQKLGTGKVRIPEFDRNNNKGNTKKPKGPDPWWREKGESDAVGKRAMLEARAHGASCYSEGKLNVCAGGGYNLKGFGGTTIGNTFWTNDGFVKLKERDPESYRRILRHEDAHRVQWEMYGLRFAQLYANDQIRSVLNDPVFNLPVGYTNGWEYRAGLEDGGYRR